MRMLPILSRMLLMFVISHSSSYISSFRLHCKLGSTMNGDKLHNKFKYFINLRPFCLAEYQNFWAQNQAQQKYLCVKKLACRSFDSLLSVWAMDEVCPDGDGYWFPLGPPTKDEKGVGTSDSLVSIEQG